MPTPYSYLVRLTFLFKKSFMNWKALKMIEGSWIVQIVKNKLYEHNFTSLFFMKWLLNSAESCFMTMPKM